MDELKRIFEEVLASHFENHVKHHEWIQARIDAEEKKRDMFDKIGQSVLQYSVMGLLGAAYYWLHAHIKL